MDDKKGDVVLLVKTCSGTLPRAKDRFLQQNPEGEAPEEKKKKELVVYYPTRPGAGTFGPTAGPFSPK